MPAIFGLYSEVSNFVMREMPLLPAHNAAQTFSRPRPSGVIIPIPVTTTLFKDMTRILSLMPR
jgi:hypothetical protein